MQYAVIATGGKQYKVVVGQTLEVEKLGDAQEVVFDQVLLVVDGEKVNIGTPTLDGVKVYAEFLGDVKADKIEVFKYKSKSRYRKHTGHRQGLAQVKITAIGTKTISSPAKPKVKSDRVTSKPAGRSVKKVAPKKKPAK